MTVLSRAELLRVLEQADNSGLDKPALGRVLGFELLDTPVESSAIPVVKQIGTNDPEREPLLKQVRSPIRYWEVVGCDPIDSESTADEPEDESQTSETKSAETKKPRSLLPRAPLIEPGVWQNLWDGMLPFRSESKRIDIPKTLRKISRNEPLDPLDYKPSKRWNRPIVIIIEDGANIRPARLDIHQSWISMSRLVMLQNMQVFTLEDGPYGFWSSLDNNQPGAETKIADDALIIFVGDFGIARNNRIELSWLAMMLRLKTPLRSLMLVSCGRPSKSPIPVYPIDHKQGGYHEMLVAALSQIWMADIDMLRYLWAAIPEASLNDLLRAYHHPDLDEQLRTNGYLQLKSNALDRHRYIFHQLPKSSRDPLQTAIKRCLQSCNKCHIEASKLQQNITQPGSPKDYEALLALISKGCDEIGDHNSMVMSFILTSLPMFEVIADGPYHDNWNGVLNDLQKIARAYHKRLPNRHHSQPKGEANLLLRQRDNSLIVSDSGSGLLAITEHAYCEQTRAEINGSLQLLGSTLDIIDRGIHWRLQAMLRPSWAERCWSERGEFFAAHHDDAVFSLTPADLQQARAKWTTKSNPWPWANDIGVDKYGLWASIDIDNIVLRMRWIAPGRFLMGSPESEAERRDNELQHEVTLSQGYWLAETACSQGLWAAVTGKRPSHFEGDDLPVEKVSWDDCVLFCKELTSRLPGSLTIRLPTEAEWEYACRAGTDTAFNWGNDLSTEQANYDGHFPYNDGKKGEYRKKTLPVDAFAPNGWGLYQMHGNVWEWCADIYGNYKSGQLTDPKGAETGGNRVLRGGSWGRDGHYLRSAFRFNFAPDIRYRLTGLRFAGGFDP